MSISRFDQENPPYRQCYEMIFDDSRDGVAPLYEVETAISIMPQEFGFGDLLNVIAGLVGGCDCWNLLNSLDHLVTRGDLVETSKIGCWGQERTFKRSQ